MTPEHFTLSGDHDSRLQWCESRRTALPTEWRIVPSNVRRKLFE
jgi:hypothetical protein